MGFCENIILVHSEPLKIQYLLEILQNSPKSLFFETFITLGNSETKKEGYGTDSDIYTEYIEIDIHPDLLKFVIYTNDTPCIEFVKRFAMKYSLQIQMIYYNSEFNFSGKIVINNYQIILNEQWNYFQGLYFTDEDRFFNEIINSFEGYTSFQTWCSDHPLNTCPEDYNKLQEHFLIYNFTSFNF